LVSKYLFSSFAEWGVRRAVTIVTDERTLQQRTAKREREEGKFVPVSAVMDMKAAFSLPAYDDGFTEIEFPEMPEQDSRQEVRRMNEEGRRFKRENPRASGNQPKPHMESRQGEFAGEKDFRNAKRQRDDCGPYDSRRCPPSQADWSGGGEGWASGPQFSHSSWGDNYQGGPARRVECQRDFQGGMEAPRGMGVETPRGMDMEAPRGMGMEAPRGPQGYGRGGPQGYGHGDPQGYGRGGPQGYGRGGLQNYGDSFRGNSGANGW
ncbi:SPRY domain-containing protein, partial [Toxoplasma gondii FOU]